MSLNKKMSVHHEEAMAAAFGGRMTKGSGNQANDKMDGKNTRIGEHYAFAWDGKATRGNSVGVSREMWAKAVEQAYDRRPMLGIGFYDDDRLRGYTHLVAVSMDDMVEVVEQARRGAAVIEHLRNGTFKQAYGFCYEEDGDYAIIKALEGR